MQRVENTCQQIIMHKINYLDCTGVSGEIETNAHIAASAATDAAVCIGIMAETRTKATVSQTLLLFIGG